MKTSRYVATLTALVLAFSAQSAVAVCSPHDDNQTTEETEEFLAEIAAMYGEATPQKFGSRPSSADRIYTLNSDIEYIKNIGAGIITAVPFDNNLLATRGYGSSTLIGSCYVLTNKHVASKTKKAFSKEANVGDEYFFSAGQNKNCNSKDSFLAQDRSATLVAMGDPNSANISQLGDWAIMRLKRPVRNARPVLIIQRPMIVKDQQLAISGFPGLKILGEANPTASSGVVRGQVVTVKSSSIGEASVSIKEIQSGMSGSPATYPVKHNGELRPALGGIVTGIDLTSKQVNILMLTAIREQAKQQGLDWQKMTESHDRDTCD